MGQDALPQQTRPRWQEKAITDSDLLAGTAIVLAALVSVLTLPAGNLLRVALTLPVLFLVPGYFLMQAIAVPTRDATRRLLHAALALALSPAIVALAALLTALFPAGFTRGAILASVTVTTLALGALASWRRVAVPANAAAAPEAADAGSD